MILCDSNNVDVERLGEGVVEGDVLTSTTKSMPDGRYHSI